MPEARRLTDRYDFLAELGRGGMGIVYLARDRSSERPVAIKLLGTLHARNAESALRFAREARTVAALDHPNIVRTLAIEELGDGAIAIVSAYVPGQTLRSVLSESGPLPFDRTAALLRDVSAALGHAHRNRIVHRDVKPENIFVEHGTGRALLSDFGIARPIDSDVQLTAVGSSLGTPSYMAPEQVQAGQLDERADVYSLGLVGWEMLTGSRPWEGETLYDVLHKQQHERLPSLAALRPDIPLYLLLAIEGALAKQPSERWANGSELLARLSPAPAALPQRGREKSDWAEAATVKVVAPTPAFSPMPSPAMETRQPETSQPEPEPLEQHANEPAKTIPAAERTAANDAALPAGSHRPAQSRRPPPSAAAAAPTRRLISAKGVAGATMAGVLIAWLALGGKQPGTDAVFGPTSDVPVRDSALGSIVPAESSVVRANPSRPESTPAPPAPETRPPAVNKPATTAAARPTTPRSDTLRRDSARTTPTVRPAPTTRPAPTAPVTGTTTAACSTPTASAQRACLIAEIDRNDAALTRTYQALIADMRREAGGVREPPAVQALRVEQRAWIAQRDRACADASRGALWGAERVPCFARMSEARDSVLQRRLQQRTGRE